LREKKKKKKPLLYVWIGFYYEAGEGSAEKRKNEKTKNRKTEKLKN
jgi:hypothetical protein